MSAVDIENLMKELRQTYLDGLPEKLQSLSDLKDQKNWSELENEFHKLKGTGRTYGLPEVTRIGELMEKICKQGGTDITDHVEASIELLELLRIKKLDNQSLDIENHPLLISIESIANS